MIKNAFRFQHIKEVSKYGRKISGEITQINMRNDDGERVEDRIKAFMSTIIQVHGTYSSKGTALSDDQLPPVVLRVKHLFTCESYESFFKKQIELGCVQVTPTDIVGRYFCGELRNTNYTVSMFNRRRVFSNPPAAVPAPISAGSYQPPTSNQHFGTGD